VAAIEHLENLWELWNETEPEGQRAIAESAIDHIEAVGLDLLIHPSAEAERYGLAEAFGSEPLVCSISQSGRGERSHTDRSDLNVPLPLECEVAGTERWLERVR
jgi:hypothetical protein